MAQPIIRGIQAVGAVDIRYRYNSADNKLPIPTDLITPGALTEIDTTTAGIPAAGFRLDGEFLRANPQVASSVVIPILGGGGVALTNNNRTGTLNLTCAKVSTPDTASGKMFASQDASLGPLGGAEVYDMVFLTQIQQAQAGGGDSVGADIIIEFLFSGKKTTLTFEGCTVATVDPVALTGNDAATYNIVLNYLNWKVTYEETK